MNKRLLRIVSVVLIGMNIFYSIVWACPAMGSTDGDDGSLQVFSRFSANHSFEYILQVSLEYIVRSIADVKHFRYCLTPVVSGVKVAIDFSESYEEDGFLHVPCSTSSEGLCERFVARLQIDGAQHASLIDIVPFETISSNRLAGDAGQTDSGILTIRRAQRGVVFTDGSRRQKVEYRCERRYRDRPSVCRADSSLGAYKHRLFRLMRCAVMSLLLLCSVVSVAAATEPYSGPITRGFASIPRIEAHAAGVTRAVESSVPAYRSVVTAIPLECEIPMPFPGCIKSTLTPGAQFHSGQTIARFTKDSMLCDEEIAGSLSKYEELKRREQSMIDMHQRDLISRKDWKEFRLNLDKALLEVNAIKYGWSRRISLPFDGRVVEIGSGQLLAGDIAMRVERTDCARIELSLPPKLARLLRRGYTFSVAIAGRKIDHRLIRIDNERLVLAISGIRLPLSAPCECELFLADGKECRLPADSVATKTIDVSYKTIQDLHVPYSGIASASRCFLAGDELDAGAKISMPFDASAVNATITALKHEIRYQQWLVSAMLQLHEKDVIPEIILQKEKLRLSQLHRDLTGQDRCRKKTLSASTKVPWDCVVIEDSYFFNGQTIGSGTMLARVARRDLFEARVVLEPRFVDFLKVNGHAKAMVEGTASIVPATIEEMREVVLKGEKRVEVILSIRDTEHVIAPGYELDIIFPGIVKTSIENSAPKPVDVDLSKRNIASADTVFHAATNATAPVLHSVRPPPTLRMQRWSGGATILGIGLIVLAGVFWRCRRKSCNRLTAGDTCRMPISDNNVKSADNPSDTVEIIIGETVEADSVGSQGEDRVAVPIQSVEQTNGAASRSEIPFYKTYDSLSVSTLEKRAALLLSLGFAREDISPVYIMIAGCLLRLQGNDSTTVYKARLLAGARTKLDELKAKHARLNQKRQTSRLTANEQKRIGYYSLLLEYADRLSGMRSAQKVSGQSGPGTRGRSLLCAVYPLLGLLVSFCAATAMAAQAGLQQQPADMRHVQVRAEQMTGRIGYGDIFDSESSDTRTLNRICASADIDDSFRAIDEIGRRGNNELLYKIAISDAVRPEAREWALLRLRVNRQTEYLLDMFSFVSTNDYFISADESNRRFSGFLVRLISEHIRDDAIALYAYQGRDDKGSGVNADNYLRFLCENFPAGYFSLVAGQLDLQGRKSVASFALSEDDDVMRRIARNLELRSRAKAFLKPRPLNGSVTDNPAVEEVLAYLGLYDREAIRNEIALKKFFDSELLAVGETVSRYAPGLIRSLGIEAYTARPSSPEKKLALEDYSNIAAYFMSVSITGERGGLIERVIREVESMGSTCLTGEFCNALNAVEIIINQSSLLRNDPKRLMDLYFSLRPCLRSELVKILLNNGLMTEERPSSAVFNGYDFTEQSQKRIFYADILIRDICADRRKQVIYKFFQTYASEFELARLLYSESEGLGAYGVKNSEIPWAKSVALGCLRKLICLSLCEEKLEHLYRKAQAAFSQRQKDAYARQYASLDALHSRLEKYGIPHEDEESFESLIGELGQHGVLSSDINERAIYYKAIFEDPNGEFWNAPSEHAVKSSMAAVLVAAVLYYCCLRPLGFLRRVHTVSKTRNADEVFRGEGWCAIPGSLLLKPIIRRWAESGGLSWRNLHSKALANTIEFLLITAAKFVINLVFIVLVIAIEGHGGLGQIVSVWLGLIVIEQIANISQELRREELGRVYYDLFPLLLENEINFFKQIRGANRGNLKYLFENSLRLSKAYAMGKLAIVYSTEHFLSLLSVMAGFALINPWLCGAYFIFSVFIIKQFAGSAAGRLSLGKLGEEKERLLSEGVRKNAFMARLGFRPNGRDIIGRDIKDGTDALIREKIKYSMALRFCAMVFPGVGALCSLPLSTLVFSRGMHNFFFLPDLAKAISEGRFAEREISEFTDTAVKFIDKYRLRSASSSDGEGDCVAVLDYLEISDLTIRVGSEPDDGGCDTRPVILESARVNIPFGTINFLGGKSGSGKTSFLHAISGLDPSQIVKGSIRVHGRDAEGNHCVVTAEKAKGHFHYFSLEGLDGIYDIEMLRALLDSDGKWRVFLAYVKKFIDIDIESIPLHDLSSGQMARLKLAFLLSSSDAPIILLDQPFSWIDEQCREECLALLKDECVKSGRIILVADPVESSVGQPGLYDNIFLIEKKELIECTSKCIKACNENSKTASSRTTLAPPNEGARSQNTIIGGKALVETFVSSLLSLAVNKRVLFVFDKTIESGKAQSLYSALRRLKKAPRFRRILENAEIITGAPEALPGIIDQYQGASSVKIFVFGSLSNERCFHGINLCDNTMLSLIDDSTFPADFYYPLLDVIVLTLMECLEPGSISSNSEAVAAAFQRIGISNVDAGSIVRHSCGALIFRIVPRIKEYDGDAALGRRANLETLMACA